MSEKRALLSLIFSMVIFGTIGIFRKHIELSSGVLAMARGFIGAMFLLFIIALKREKLSKAAIKKNLWFLILSGAFIGFNWILLFEAYRYTTVATATLCYYLAPIFVIIASPLILKERLSGRKVMCVLVALAGMVFVSRVLQVGFTGLAELKGVLFGLGAAAFYASVILLNKKITDIPAYDKTIVQLVCAATVLVPYVLLTGELAVAEWSGIGFVLVLVVGILHTGVTYALYFGSMAYLKAQTVAIFSYIDPIVAILLSAVLLQEKMDGLTILGMVLILGAAVYSELHA
ncbi:MAG: DMT family transporter [Lachnospiraceae bacterium]|nr:DMT family transporter [Lachnospiraceae bacterium]MBR4060218.1 DMT family transporter [Lachnospiraceae bacterium]